MKKIYAIIIAIAMTMSSSAVYADDTLVSRQVKNQDTIEINPSAPPTETPNQAQAESINETVSPTETPISTITTDKSKTDLIFDNILSLKENYDIKSKIENAIDTNGVLLDEESRRDFIEQFSDIQEKIDEIIIEDQTFVDVCNQNTDYQLLHDLYVKMLDYQTQLDTNVPMLFSEIPNPKVTYDANGGTGSVPEVQDYTINTRVNVRFSPLPKKDYYVFFVKLLSYQQLHTSYHLKKFFSPIHSNKRKHIRYQFFR
ncbi:MAG: hypothetical protein RSC48_01695 [Anaerorhabdus sp.]